MGDNRIFRLTASAAGNHATGGRYGGTISGRNTVVVLALTAFNSVAAAAQISTPPQPPHRRVSGIVLEGGRTPVPNVELQLVRPSELTVAVRSGEDGRFSFPDVADGAIEITVRRLGYRARVVPISVGPDTEAHPLVISLDALPSELEMVEVVGQDSRLREFNQRKTQHSSGSFITQVDIQKLNPRFASDLFRKVPGASLRSGRLGNIIRLRGCRPKVWIDGVPMRDIELDELTTPAQIAGLEIYPSVAGLPPQYMDTEPRPCGVILVWSRVE